MPVTLSLSPQMSGIYFRVDDDDDDEEDDEWLNEPFKVITS